jgi:CRP-like cAMP-binding protein
MVVVLPDIDEDQDGPVKALDIHVYRYGDEIIREGEHTSCFFVILDGQVRITQHGRKIRLLEDHDVFGMESMIFKQPSLYSVKALTRSRVATYGHEALDHFIRENPRMTQNILVSVLQQLMQTSLHLAEETQAFALEDVRVDFYGDGEIIIKEGSVGTDFYRLVSSQGGLRVSIRGKEISRIKTPGEFFGEMAGLVGLPRQATVTSIGESMVESYSFNDLEVIIRDYPEIALRMMRTFVSRLINVNQQLTNGSPVSLDL